MCNSSPNASIAAQSTHTLAWVHVRLQVETTRRLCPLRRYTAGWRSHTRVVTPTVGVAKRDVRRTRIVRLCKFLAIRLFALEIITLYRG